MAQGNQHIRTQAGAVHASQDCFVEVLKKVVKSKASENNISLLTVLYISIKTADDDRNQWMVAYITVIRFVPGNTASNLFLSWTSSKNYCRALNILDNLSFLESKHQSATETAA